MRVLITGATGMIGSAVSDALLARGDGVVGLTRSVEKAKAANPAVRWYEWSSTTERPPDEAFDDVDAVINLIGEEINQRWTDEAKKRIRESRTISAKNLLDAISTRPRPKRPRVFIGASAIGFYGDQGAKLLDEDSPQGEGFGAEVVAAWEAAQREAEGLVARTAIARTGLVLTKRGGLIKQLLPPFKLGVGGPIGGGEQFMSWITLEDEIALLLWILDNDLVAGTINLTAPAPVTNREFSKALGKALRRPAAIPAPGLAVKLLRGSEMAEQLVLGSARVMPRRALDAGYRFRYPELSEGMKAALQ